MADQKNGTLKTMRSTSDQASTTTCTTAADVSSELQDHEVDEGMTRALPATGERMLDAVLSLLDGFSISIPKLVDLLICVLFIRKLNIVFMGDFLTCYV